MTFLDSTNACTQTNGSGMVTSWVLSGSETWYIGSLATDGYQVTATLNWADPGISSPTVGLESPAANDEMGMGSCIETLSTSGSVQDLFVTDNGNYAICHWVFFQFAAGTVTMVESEMGTNEWGSTKYLTAVQWGVGGSAIIGNIMNTSAGGTAISVEKWGMVSTPTAAVSTFTVLSGVKTWAWYQPIYANTYGVSNLRRYGGGYNNSTADKVRGYCVS